MYQNEIFQATCDCYLLQEDNQLFLITFKVGSINQGVSGKIHKIAEKIAFLLIHPT